MMMNKIITCFIGLCSISMVLAETPLQVERDIHRYSLIDHAQYYIDNSAALSIDEVIKQQDQLAFQTVKRNTLSFGHLEVPIWIKLQIVNPHDKTIPLLFEIDYARLNHLHFYVRNKNNENHEKLTGLSHPYDTRDIKYRTYVFRFDAVQYDTTDVYLKIESTHAIFIPLAVSTSKGFHEHAANDRSFLAAFFGLMAGMILYNLFLFFSIRDRSYLYYVLFMFNIFYFQFSFQGLHASLFSESIWWNNHSIVAFIYFTISAGAIFTRNFLNTASKGRFFHISFLLIAMASFFLGAYSLIFGSDGLARISGLSGLVFCVLAIAAGITRWVQGFQAAKYYLLAWSALVIGAVILILQSLNIMPTNEITRWSMQIGSAAEALLLSFGLAYRINMLKKEKSESERDSIIARAESEAKSEFLSKMSHEIRTPLNGMLGMIYILKDSQLTEDQLHYLEIAHNSGRALLTVINDVLDYSKIVAGKMELETVAFNLEKLISESVSLFSIHAHEKNIELLMSIQPGVPEVVAGDPTRLRQVLVNLISNALKFTEEGEIAIRVSRPDKQDESKLKFTVSDTGIGISSEGLKKLFKSFSQADNTTTRRFGGTGLGLSISHELVELMGGGISVESELGEGTAFSFVLSMPESEDEEVIGTPPLGIHVDLSDVKILIVDDNVSFCQAMKEQALTWGMKVDIAFSGELALGKIRQAHHSGKPFDVVTIDIVMPTMDGLDLAHRIRKIDGGRALKLMLITAYQRPIDQVELKKLNINSVLVKPTAPCELREALELLLGSQHIKPLPEQKILNPQYPRLRVLVAEDNAVNQMVIKGLLKRFSIEPDVVENGKEAVSLFNRYIRKPYQLILMDIEMPEMDGHTATKRIRETERRYGMSRTVIYALSAHALDEHEKASLEVGMDGHLKKPIDVERLRNELVRQFE